MYKLVLFLLLLAAAMVSAQPDQRSYHPDHFNVCTDQKSCILVKLKHDGNYVGLIDMGTKDAWNFELNDFRMEHIKLIGTSIATDSDGRHQVVVVEGKPNILYDGIARGKAKYTVGNKSKTEKVTVTWEPQPHDFSGMHVN